MTDYEQAMLAQLGMLTAAISALFLTHPDKSALRLEFERHASVIQASHMMLSSPEARREANALMKALLDALN